MPDDPMPDIAEILSVLMESESVMNEQILSCRWFTDVCPWMSLSKKIL